MRALIAAPERIPPGRYRRFVRRAQVRGLLADHLYLGEPYLALNALVLSARETVLLRRLTEAFAAAFDRAARALAGDVPRLVGMGFPWAAAELLAAETPRDPLAGRFDFVLDRAGTWWLLEFNADTPSGIREATVADALVHRLLREARGLYRPNEGLAEALRMAFCAAVADIRPGLALGLLTDAGQLEDLAQMAFTQRLLAEPLAARGVEVVLGDARNLAAVRGGLALCGLPIGALYRYLPFESMYGTAGFSALYDAVLSGRVALLNGLYGLLLQHKGLMAWLWAHRDDACFSAAERAAIVGHLPPTWPVSGGRDGLPWKVALEPGKSALEPAELVFKQVFGREGEEVFFGEDLSPGDLAEIVRRRTYIAQRRIEVAPVEAALPSSLGTEMRQGFATVGSYAVNGRWAGFYSRLGAKVVSARAKWLATLSE